MIGWKTTPQMMKHIPPYSTPEDVITVSPVSLPAIESEVLF
jgi:hypothetical protein